MNLIDNITTMDNMIEALSITILHSLWQGLLIAVILGIVLKALKRKAAQTRYVASMSAILVLLFVVMGTFLITFQSEENLNATSSVMPTLIYEDLSELTTTDKFIQDSPVSKVSSFYYNTVETIKTYADMIFICWLVGVGFFSLRFVSGLYYIQKIKTQKIQPVSDFWQQQLESMCQKMGISLKVKILKSALVDVPTVVGWLRPVILMPVSMLSQMPVAEIEAILAHELAHIRRFDYLFNMLQSVIEILLFFNPAAWWISVCINDERENCCDDLALKATGSIKAYVNALANLAHSEYTSPELSLSVMGKKGSVLYRIKRIVGKRNNQLETANALSQRTLGRFTAALITLFLLVFFTVSSGYKQSNAMTPEWKTDQVMSVLIGDTTKKKKLQVIDILVDDTSSEIAQDSNVWVNKEIFTIENGDTIMHNIVAIGEGGTWVGKNVMGEFNGADKIIEIHSENDSLVNVHEVKVMHLKNGEMIREDFMEEEGLFNAGDSMKWVIHVEEDGNGKNKHVQVIYKDGDKPMGMFLENDLSKNYGEKVIIVRDKNTKVNQVRIDEQVVNGKKVMMYKGSGNGTFNFSGDSSNKKKQVVYINSDSIHSEEHHDEKIKIVSTNDGKDPLYVIDGKVVSNSEVVELDPYSIKHMEVLKGESAITLYGEKGRDGVILITTKTLKEPKEKAKTKTEVPIKDFIDSYGTYAGIDPLLVVNGNLVSMDEIYRIDPQSIKHVGVLKEEDAIAKYGEKGRMGAVLITTKTLKEPKKKAKEKTKIKVEKIADSDSNQVVKQRIQIKSLEELVIFIDGFESSPKTLEALDVKSIATVEVIKGEKAIEKFGVVGKKGVMLVKTKKGAGPVEEEKNLVTKSALAQSVVAYPNPTDGEMQISFELKEKEKVSIEIFDLSGKKVDTLLNKSMSAGMHNVTWDSKDLPSGAYLLNIATNNEKIERKILLNK